jgi:hypothetical protein
MKAKNKDRPTDKNRRTEKTPYMARGYILKIILVLCTILI